MAARCLKATQEGGESNIRGYLLENDWLEAIVQMPNDMFYNTGITTYIWIISKDKSEDRVGKVQLIDASKCSVKRRKPIGSKRNEFSDECIALIEKAYLSNDNCTMTEGELTVESKVFPVEHFKYTKVVVERPLRDEDGNLVLKGKNKQPDSKLSDTEIIPWTEDFDDYMRKNVLPYAPDAWIDEKKSKVGYEIPFTREFYKYTPLKPSVDIFEELKVLEQQESELMEKLLH